MSNGIKGFVAVSINCLDIFPIVRRFRDKLRKLKQISDSWALRLKSIRFLDNKVPNMTRKAVFT